MQFPVDRLHAGTAHEAHRGSYGRRNDYVNHSRTDSRSGFLRVDEGASFAAWNVADRRRLSKRWQGSRYWLENPTSRNRHQSRRLGFKSTDMQIDGRKSASDSGAI